MWRRFTRDPPVLGKWSTPLSQFTLNPTATFNVTGSSHAGTYQAHWSTTEIAGYAGWINLTGGIYLFLLTNNNGSSWTFQITNNTSWAWKTDGLTWPSGTISTIPATQVGTPPITQPSLLTLTDAAPYPLIIPATFISAWRPQ